MNRAKALNIVKAAVMTPLYIIVAAAAIAFMAVAELAIALSTAVWRIGVFIFDCGKIGVDAALSKDGH